MANPIREAASLSLTRVQVFTRETMDVLKSIKSYLQGDINAKMALGIIGDRGVKTIGACAGATGGIYVGTVLTATKAVIAATNWWNPIGWGVLIMTTWGGCVLGHKLGKKISSIFDLTDLNKSFAVLGIPYTEDKEIVREQYKKLCRIRHPDKGGTNAEFQELNNAYTLITTHYAFNDRGRFEKIFSYMFAGAAWLFCAGLNPINASIAVASTTKKIMNDC